MLIAWIHVQVFEDHAGALVISFDRTAAVKEGDITAYMNQMAKQGDLVIQYRWAARLQVLA